MDDDMCPNCLTPWKCNGPHESVLDQNLRVLKHEAETPMRGHDDDGECCRRAKFGVES